MNAMDRERLAQQAQALLSDGLTRESGYDYARRATALAEALALYRA
jgi:hypothetical protein